MDRAKFKEALNGLTSEQRTALLYLENQIKETKSKSVSRYDYDEMIKKQKESIKFVINTVEYLDHMVDEINKKDISEYKKEITEITKKLREENIDEYRKLRSEVLNRNLQATKHYNSMTLNVFQYSQNVAKYTMELYKNLKNAGISVPEFVPVIYDPRKQNPHNYE